MSVDIIREALIQRIQKEDEQHVRILLAVSDALNKDAQSEDQLENRLAPMTVQELIARAELANKDIKEGRLYSREEIEASLGL